MECTRASRLLHFKYFSLTRQIRWSFSSKNQKASTQSPDSPDTELPQSIRHPRSVEALYLKPLRREAKYGVPSCDLQLRSYSIQPLDFFADFALRAAYYLGLPAYGPIPLPRITERWTVPKSHFIFKKAQENFERVTLRRLIQIKDGHPETLQLWLAYIRRHQYYGVGMKANVWEFGEAGHNQESVASQSEEFPQSWAQLGQIGNITMSGKAGQHVKSP